MGKTRHTATGLLLLVVLAFLGFVLVYLPPQVLSQYQLAREAGPLWGTIYAVVVGSGALLLGGSTAWILFRLWRRTRTKGRRRQQLQKNPSQLSRAEQSREIDENLTSVEQLSDEAAVDDSLRRELHALAEKIEAKREYRRLEIVAFGTISSGKSSLLNVLAGRNVFRTDAKGGTTVQRNEVPWPGHDQVVLVDTPGLGEVDGTRHRAVAAEAARDADLVLLVVDGPLRDTEFDLLRRLGEMEKRVLVCLNKADWYSDADRQSLVNQLAEQLRDSVAREDIVGVRSRPAERTRVRVLADGSQLEEAVVEPPDIGSLADRMLHVVRRDGSDLLLANMLLQSRGLVEEARHRVQAALDARAWQIVDHYMWGAGGAAALSPVPVLDLAAGSAITVKMVLELSRVYGQPLDAESAVQLLAQLGKNLVSILGVSAATPAVTAAVASVIKTVPGIGTVAGGLLQGVVQCVVTRWIGTVFIRYFKGEISQTSGALASAARREWEHVTQLNQLRKIVVDARRRLGEPFDAEDTETGAGRDAGSQN